MAVPYADRRQKAIDPKVLDTFAGVYADPSPSGALTICRDGSRLMAQGANEQEKTELLAVTVNAFSIRGEGDTVLMVFEKQPNGTAFQIRVHNISGSEQVLDRMK